MTLMQRGVDLFRNKALAAAGRDVVFMRGGTTHSLRAWVTESVYSVVDASGIPVSITTRDYKFRKADLPVIPRAGDRFSETIDGENHVVEVMPLADEPGSSWVDSDGQIVVARCKTVSLET